MENHQEYNELMDEANKFANDVLASGGSEEDANKYREHAELEYQKTSHARYMPGTKFEMVRFNGPDDMHRTAIRTLGIGINWTTNGDAVGDPEHYTESFEIIDRHAPENNAKGLTRTECEQKIYDLYCDEVYK